MAIHHIIPKHEWKARFGNLKGFNAPDNTVDLYTEQHGQVHLHYFNEITHIEYDRIAGLAILKQIGKEEAQRLATIKANSGRKHTIEDNQANAARGKEQWTDESRNRQSLLMRGDQRNAGKKHKPEQNQAHSTFMMGNHYRKGS